MHSLALPENLIDFHVANRPARCEMYTYPELLNNFPGFFGEKPGKLGGTDNCRISCCFTSRSLFIYFLLCFSYYRAEILDGDKSLVIKNVVPSDEGAYVCEAQNSVGQITSKAQLVVNCEYIQHFSSFSLSALLFIGGVSSRSTSRLSIRCSIQQIKQFKVRSNYIFSTLSLSLRRS